MTEIGAISYFAALKCGMLTQHRTDNTDTVDYLDHCWLRRKASQPLSENRTDKMKFIVNKLYGFQTI